MAAQQLGLRELKKQMTRESIGDAALRLTLEKGLDHVTVDEIAHQAFVSPRTVSNYFSGKEEAVISAGEQEWLTLAFDLPDLPKKKSLLKSLGQIAANFARSRSPGQLDLIVQKAELIERYPSLGPFQAAQYARLEDALRQAIAARTGTNAELDLYPCLVAGTAVSAIKVAVAHWVRTGAEHDHLPHLLEQAFAEVQAGLPAPQQRRNGSAA